MAIASVAEISSTAARRLVEPVADSMAEEVRVAVGVTKRESVGFEKEPHQRALVGVRHPHPHRSQSRAMCLCLGAAAERSQSVADTAQELLDEVLFRPEMMEKDRCLRSECDSQGSQRQVGDAVDDHVVDGAVEEFLAALRIRRSGHQPARTWRSGREVSWLTPGHASYYNSRNINCDPVEEQP